VVERIREFLRRKPFRRFRVVMRSGERHDITDPDRVALGQMTVHWFPPSGRWTQMSDDEIELVYEPRRAR
jgi:hypothetical protein